LGESDAMRFSSLVRPVSSRTRASTPPADAPTATTPRRRRELPDPSPTPVHYPLSDAATTGFVESTVNAG